MFFMWFDDTKKPTATKIIEGCAMYEHRFGHAPLFVGVSVSEDALDVPELIVCRVAHIQKHNYWFGMEVVT